MERKNERYHRCNQTCDTRFAFRWFESHGPRRALALFCAFFLALQVLFPCKAAFAYYPSEEVILGDQATTDNFGTVGVGYMVIAYNNLRATLLALGVQPTDSRLTSEVRAKLSNASSGGSFYEYSTTFLTQSQLGGELPPWTFGVRDFIDTWETIAGSGDQYGPYMDVFYSSASRELYNNAKRDLNTILNGGSLGGGSGGTGEESYLLVSKITRPDYDVTNTVQCTDGTTVAISQMPQTVRVKVSLSVYRQIEQYMGDGYGLYCSLVYPDTSGDQLGLQLYLFEKNKLTVTDKTVTVNNSPYEYKEYKWDIYSYYYIYTIGNISFGSIVSVKYDKVNDIVDISNESFTHKYVTGGTINNYNRFFTDLETSSNPVTPPNNWPTDPIPTPPTGPTVPDPPTSTPVDPPSDPVGGNPPSFPTQIITVDTTYPVADLQAVLDAMAEHCEHIRDEIYADTSGLYDNLTTFLANQFQVLRNFLGDENNWLFESLENEFQRMMDYLKDLAEWLAGQMKFDISGGDYDDSTVVSWLKRIYLKLGTGGVSTKPVDPVADPVGAWDWLSALIQQILTALAGGAAALTGTLGELFNGVRTKFPFSIPWDVVAIVTLFDAAPVTPAFTIAYSVFGANVRYDIDLHFFDQQAAMIRAVENVLFCAYLLFKTDWLLNVFGGLSNFLGVKAAGVLKG